MRYSLLLTGAAALVAANLVAAESASAKPVSHAKTIATAVSAAPAGIGAHATVITFDAKMNIVVLRKGDNGWTCLPDDPRTPGLDPMCTDANGMAWMHAWMMHEAPPADKPGMAYMLRGGWDASNLDPFASKPADGKTWVVTGPHVMILSAEAAKQSGYPAGQGAPDTSKPYVMYAGTPYAHIMLPVK